MTLSVVDATFGIQNATPCPAATYACCPDRTSASASVASRACRSNARSATVDAAICLSEWSRKAAEAAIARIASVAMIQRATRERIRKPPLEYHKPLMLATLTLAVFFAQSSARGVVVSGVVQDQTGAVLP